VRADVGPRQRLALTVAYDGSAFHGFATQRNQPELATVAGTLTDAISRVLRQPIELTCAGRTDAGVHGWGQVVSFDADLGDLTPGDLLHRVNRLCGPTIAVRQARLVAADFDARFSATARVYRYTVLNRSVPDPFLAATTWHVPEPLAVRSMQLACDPLIGEHDFSSFCRRPQPRSGDPEPSLVRRVVDARWRELDDGRLRFEIEATAFCHQMVRSIVGLLVDVGRQHRRHAGDVRGILEARDRDGLPNLAPPQGLCLWQVRYDRDPAWYRSELPRP